MKFVLVINNEEALANDDDPDISESIYEIGELLRSGYYEVESVYPVLDHDDE